jgi:hypothetical protein
LIFGGEFMSELNINEKVKINEKIIALVSALLIGIIFDRLFVDKAIGISYPIFVILIIWVFFFSLKKTMDMKINTENILIGIIFLLSFYFSFRSNVVIRTINYIIIPFLLVAASLIISKKEESWYAPSFIGKLLSKGILDVLENFHEPVTVTSQVVKSASKSNLSTGKKQVIKGLIIVVPILVVVMGLLSSADMVFNYYIQNISNIFEDIRFDEIIRDIFVTLLVGFYSFSYLWSFKKEKPVIHKVKKNRSLWEPITNLTVIATIDIVYLLFTIIQFSYLYGGSDVKLPTGFTFADYARRGFFELVTVAVINYILVMLSSKNIHKSMGKVSYTVKIFVTLLAVFTMNMIFSAHYKLSLYESTYGLTYLRVYVHLFMIVMFLLCLFAIISLWIEKFSLSKSLIITLLVSYTIISYINVDAYIAKTNIERYKKEGKIDYIYLKNLSNEAVTYLLELKDDKNTNISNEIKDELAYRKEKLNREKSIFEFNFSNMKARKLLNDINIQYN